MRSTTRFYPIVLAGTVFLLLFAVRCGRSKAVVIREKVEERVRDFRKKETAKCQAELLAEAGKIADSLLLQEALQEVTDSLARLRPFRPVKPGVLSPIDSATVKPIFDR